MTIEENKAIATQWYEALRANDMDGMVALYAETGSFNVFGRTPISGAWTDRNAFFDNALPKIMGGLAEVKFATRYRILMADERYVCAMMEGQGTGKNGKDYPQQYTQIFGIEDGKIVEFFEWFDTALVEEVIFDNALARGDTPPETRVDIG